MLLRNECVAIYAEGYENKAYFEGVESVLIWLHEKNSHYPSGLEVAISVLKGSRATGQFFDFREYLNIREIPIFEIFPESLLKLKNMKEKVFSKQDEIKAIKALVEMDGYFADAFGEDLETIIDNINKDYAFEASTKLDCTITKLKENERELKQIHANEIAGICDDLLYIYTKTGDEQLYDIVLDRLGQKGMILRKRAMGIALSEKEIDYMISNIK
jgi:hypothetical protein